MFFFLQQSYVNMFGSQHFPNGQYIPCFLNLVSDFLLHFTCQITGLQLNPSLLFYANLVLGFASFSISDRGVCCMTTYISNPYST